MKTHYLPAHIFALIMMGSIDTKKEYQCKEDKKGDVYSSKRKESNCDLCLSKKYNLNQIFGFNEELIEMLRENDK